ncbi:hypothetical protein NQ317_009336 [Molorchus minor]|uniref:RRM domain-containing protein n=1 Tax=Molorchus minor TaxID=1323400 RepID=A0ABQ9JI67_9CUCU|nr:hypothetical protein NQ317_009336 [Molorchus minor]
MAVGHTKVVQVTNIAPQATKDQMHILFGYLGKIEDIRLYPTIRDVSCPVQSRICYIKFVDQATVGIAQHMTNTVFIDRALIVIPVTSSEIPDEYYALEMTRNGTIVPGLNLNEPKLPMHVVNSVQGSGADQVILTTDPNLESNGLPPYPPLPSNYDTQKIEETRRTILMLNVDPSTTNEEIIEFFSTAGEIKYLRTCTQESDINVQHMLIEFSDQSSILNVLKMNGMEFKGKPLDLQHAIQPIIKPIREAPVDPGLDLEVEGDGPGQGQDLGVQDPEDVDLLLAEGPGLETVGADQSPVQESVRVLYHADQSLEADLEGLAKSKDRKSREKSRDKSRDRKRSRDRDKKSRERDSKEKKDKPTRDSKEKRVDKESNADDKKRSRSRSKSRRRSRSKDRKRDRKRSRSRGSRRRTPSPRSVRKRSRSRSRDKDKKRDKRSDRKEKDKKDRDRRSRSRSSRSTRSHSKVPRNYDEEEKGFDTDKDKTKEREPKPPSDKGSPEKSDNMDISNSP